LAGAILILTQMPDRTSAQSLARSLVETRLAACVSIGATVESLYHWQGQIETAQEVPVVVKTRAERYSDVETAIRAQHPYELPEILAVPVVQGLARYMEWITDETAGN
jgi:periplasmic divalent cation tolerance protein